MREAGVAGDGFPDVVWWEVMTGVLLPCGCICGEGFADFGLGKGGGGISESVSGETEAFSESVASMATAPGGCEFPCVVETCSMVRFPDDRCCSSASSVRAWAFNVGVVPVFLRCGLVIGDCRTFGLALTFAAFVFRTFFARSFALPASCAAEGPLSKSISPGELVFAAPNLWSYGAAPSFCACNAGDVNGLKYAPGTVYCVSMGNVGSSGVTAGETSGVNDS
jgi:hypothetical protein